MKDINKIIDVLYAYKLGIPIIWRDNYGSWWEAKREHIFDFHNEYLIVYNGNVQSELDERNVKNK